MSGVKVPSNTAIKRGVQRSAYRATSHKPKPCKEKHLRNLAAASFHPGTHEEIIRSLAKRIEKQNWAVVLKALIAFHRVFRDGEPSFIESIKTRSSLIFSLRRFSLTAPPNHLFTVFVKKYAKYLEEKVSVYRLLGYQFEKNKDICKTVKGDAIFKVIPKLQSQLNALLNTKMKAVHVGQTLLLHRTYVLLMKDSLLLYSMLNDGVLRLLDMFWKMGREDAMATLNIYKLFVKETDALIGFYEMGKTFVSNLPDINRAEASIIDQMEKYAQSLAPDANPTKKNAVQNEEGSQDLSDEDKREYDAYEQRDEGSDEASDKDEEGNDDEEEDDDDDDESEEDAKVNNQVDTTDFMRTFLLSGQIQGVNPFTAALFAHRPSSSLPQPAPAQQSAFASQSYAITPVASTTSYFPDTSLFAPRPSSASLFQTAPALPAPAPVAVPAPTPLFTSANTYSPVASPFTPAGGSALVTSPSLNRNLFASQPSPLFSSQPNSTFANTSSSSLFGPNPSPFASQSAATPSPYAPYGSQQAASPLFSTSAQPTQPNPFM